MKALCFWIRCWALLSARSELVASLDSENLKALKEPLQAGQSNKTHPLMMAVSHARTPNLCGHRPPAYPRLLCLFLR